MDEAPPATTPALQPLRRRLFGYARGDVDLTIGELQQAIVDLHHVLAERTEELTQTRQTLAGVRQQLRYWDDRQALAEADWERSRAAVERMEREARERADKVEADARERSLRMIDRVSEEAERIIQNAREEARELSTKLEAEHQLVQQRIDRLHGVQQELQCSLHDAVVAVEAGMRNLNSTAPSAVAVAEHRGSGGGDVERTAVHPAPVAVAPADAAPVVTARFGRKRANDTHVFNATVVDDAGASSTAG